MEETGAKPTRHCKDCGIVSEDLTLFVKNKQSKHGRRNLCISCVVKTNEAHPKCRDWKTEHQVQKRYGVDVETYKERMNTSACCEICGKTDSLCYDHCHDTNVFRGVLCRGCNRSIGQLGDTLESIMRVVKYLSKKENT